MPSFLARPVSRRLSAVLILAVVGAVAMPVLSSSSAYFTDSISRAGSGTAATLDPVATFSAAKTGSPLGSSTRLDWSSATDLAWATQNGVTTGVEYTVKRSETSDFSAAETVYKGTDKVSLDEPFMPPTRTTTLANYNGGACSLSASQIYCWGENAYGQRGTGATSASSGTPTPVLRTGDLSNKTITSIEAGLRTVCALDSVGRAYCWGENGNGQTGHGDTTSPQTSPLAVVTSGALNGKQLKTINVGFYHTCALDSVGAMYCWGLNQSGQLGPGVAKGSSSSSPVAVPATGALAGVKFASISLGNNHTCGLSTRGEAYCWGLGSSGQLGSGPVSSTEQPQKVSTAGVLEGVKLKQIAAGANTTCTIDMQGQAYCWGENRFGALGNGTSTSATNTNVPVKVLSGDVRFASIDVGTWTTCAVSTTGAAYCWGYNNLHQVDGDATKAAYNSQTTPLAVSTAGVLNGKTIVSIAAMDSSTCALATTGMNYCWGRGANGELGNGTTSQNPISVVETTPPAGATGTLQPTTSCVSGRAPTAAGQCTDPLSANIAYQYQLTYTYNGWISATKSTTR